LLILLKYNQERELVMQRTNLIEKIKKSKPFCKHDVVIYAVLSLFIAILFLSFFGFSSHDNANGFNVTLNGQKVLNYSFETNALFIESAFTDSVEKTDDGQKVLITIRSGANKEQFNVLSIDKAERSVKVVDANCSSSKECAHMPKIHNTGAIFCAPHGLSITCGFIPPMVG
jgi:hypothetical protein